MDSAPVAGPVIESCKDTIEGFADPGLKNRRHLLLFDGPLDHDAAAKHLHAKRILLVPDGGMAFVQFNPSIGRNTFCNNIDTMNTMLLRSGKPRIHVRKIINQDRIDYDFHGKPRDDKDPDALLVLFCEKLVETGSAPIQIARPWDLENDVEFQRSYRKASDIYWKGFYDNLIEQLTSTTESGIRDRAELEARILDKEEIIAKRDKEVAEKNDMERDAELSGSLLEGQRMICDHLQAECGGLRRQNNKLTQSVQRIWRKYKEMKRVVSGLKCDIEGNKATIQRLEFELTECEVNEEDAKKRAVEIEQKLSSEMETLKRKHEKHLSDVEADMQYLQTRLDNTKVKKRKVEEKLEQYEKKFVFGQ